MRYEREITDFVALETTLIKGTTLQHGFITEKSPDTCTALIYSNPGTFYFDVPDRLDVVVDSISRSQSYETARSDCEEVFNALIRRIDKALPVVVSGNELKIQTSEATVTPQWMGLDENKLHIWEASYILRLKLVE